MTTTTLPALVGESEFNGDGRPVKAPVPTRVPRPTGAAPGGPRILGYFPDGAPIYGISGAEGGYHTEGDLVRATIDGRDINGLWAEFQAVLEIVNSQRTTITNLLSFRTTRSADLVAQSTEDSGFDLASEFGVPTALRPEHPLVKVGFGFRDYDKASRATWRFLRDATAEQVEASHRTALAADNKLTTESILARVLNPTPGENEDGVPVLGLYSGDDAVPPRSGFRTFTAGHNHYLTSESDAPDGKDLDDLARHVVHHGYGTLPGTRLLLFVNPEDLPAVASIRAGEAGATYDFIASDGAPAYLTAETLVGDRPPGDYNGLRIAGSYGDVWIAPVEMMPPGYLIMVATDGPNGTLNPVGFREHPTPAYQGLRLMPGNQSGYPLVESFYARAFGVGVRHRGAAAVLQITPSTVYTPPAELAGVVL